jgi:hypothetical protein
VTVDVRKARKQSPLSQRHQRFIRRLLSIFGNFLAASADMGVATTKEETMGMHPRWIKEGSVYSLTQRTVDRQFLFKPDAVTRNIIGASAARALRKHPVKLYWLDSNINHEQVGLAPLDGTKESLTNMVRFKQTFHRLLAEELNRYLEREGSIFSSPSRDVECLDNESVQGRIEYALTNPVKDGLVDRVAHWKGFSSYGALARGEDPVYTYIDRTAWHKAGGKSSGKPMTAYTKSIRLTYTPLPGTEHMSPAKRASHLRRRCRELEQGYREEREREGRTVMSKARLEKFNHRDRPKTKPVRTKKPICHAASIEAEQEYIESYRKFLDAYRIASAAYLSGCFDVAFPSGSFKPPIIEAAA